MSFSIRQEIDWARLGALRVRAKSRADGTRAGLHRSRKHGAGVEFGGHRDYIVGDDLRWLDRHAMFRHGRPMVREFETDTDRTVLSILDGSASMGFRSEGVPYSKFQYASLIAAAVSKVANDAGDRIALDWMDERRITLPPSGGRQGFERLLAALGGATVDAQAEEHDMSRIVARVSRNAGAGSVMLLFTDLLDLPAQAQDLLAPLMARGRQLVIVRVLDPVEVSFPFQSLVRLRATEGGATVEADASARVGYQQALLDLANSWTSWVSVRGGLLVKATTSEDVVDVAGRVLLASQGNAA